jgi:hypothetical protein
MLLKEGYRHVYISRIFAAKHGFIPKDAVPGHYGYGGIVQWVVSSSSFFSTFSFFLPHSSLARSLAVPLPFFPLTPLPDRTHPPFLFSLSPFLPSNAKLTNTANSIGKFPITLPPGPTTTTHTLYLTEETHFDVVLGRSFIERRGIMFDGVDQTRVVCRMPGKDGKSKGREGEGNEGEEEEVKLEVEIVVLRDGRGEVVTVT